MLALLIVSSVLTANAFCFMCALDGRCKRDFPRVQGVMALVLAAGLSSSLTITFSLYGLTGGALAFLCFFGFATCIYRVVHRS